MGVLVNGSLLVLGTIVAIFGISFFVREKEMGSLRVCILLLGIFAALWCCGYGFMGMYTSSMGIGIPRAIGLFSIVGYLGVLLVMLMLLINMPEFYRNGIAIVYFIYGFSDGIMMSKLHNHDFVQVDGRTAYYILNTFTTVYHKIYIVLSFVLILGMAFIWFCSRRIKRNKKIIAVLILAHFFLVISCVPDTVLPMFGLPSFPASCYGVAVSYIILWYNCVHNNVLNITVQNVSAYVYQAMNVNILVFDMEQKLYMANDSSHTFFALPGVLGQTFSELFSIKKEDAEKYFNDAIDEKIEELKLQTRHNNKSCSLRFTVAKDKAQKPYCLLVFVYDLTKEEEILNDLKMANQAKSDFLSSMSHEIRTPINAIIGMNEMILREETDEQILEYASSVRNASSALMSIVNEILDISKIESGKIDTNEAEYELTSLLFDCYNMTIEKARLKKIEMKFHCAKDIPYLLHGDVVRIRQILMNLITNAIKYTKQGRVDVFITGERKEEKVFLKFAIQDTGIGIAPEDVKRLFAKFERLDLKKNLNVEGTGLGLYITKILTEFMGGTIEVESEIDKGSIFTVVIPQRYISDNPVGIVDMQMLGNDEKMSGYTAGFIAPDARILVVDDVEVNLKVFVNLLKKLGMKIDTALSGEECIALTLKNKYDLIFMDHMMPGMNGIVTFEKIRESAENMNIETPVIMLTANVLSGMKEMYLEKGFADYLSKPIDGLKLEKKVEKYLPEKKVVRRLEESKEICRNKEGDVMPLMQLKSRIPDMDIDKAIQYCAGSEEFYLQCLKDYANSDRKTVIRQCYENEDWKRYAIEVHALKSISRTLGFDSLGNMAEKLQHAAEAEDVSIIKVHTPELLEEYMHILQAITDCL